MNRRYWIAILFFIMIGGLLLTFKDQITGKSKISGLWIGSYHHLDKDAYSPLAILYDFQKDSLHQVRLSILDAEKTIVQPWRWSGSNLRIDTNLILHQNLKLGITDLVIGQPYPNYFRRPYPVDLEVEKADIISQLTGKVWDSKNEQFFFKDSTQVLLINKKENSIKQYCWSVNRYKEYLFLIFEGNPNNCTGSPHFTTQIINWSTTHFSLEKFHQSSVQQVDYQLLKATKKDFEVDHFQTCNPFLYMYYPPHRYYYQGTRYGGGGLYKIRKIFAEEYHPPPQSNANGLIRVRFIVNCIGKAGRFELLTLDNDYQEFSMDTRVTQQVMSICQNLQSWIPGTNSNTNESIDTYKYLSFKIKDGKITDIFP